MCLNLNKNINRNRTCVEINPICELKIYMCYFLNNILYYYVDVNEKKKQKSMFKYLRRTFHTG